MKTRICLLLFAAICNATFGLIITIDKKYVTSVFVEGNTEFACDLYGQLKDADGNLFFSPFSISTALTSVYAGAREQTAEQMAKTLRIPEIYTNPRSYLEAELYGWLLDQLNDPNRSDAYQLSVANALWAQKDFPFCEQFISINQQYYNARLENVDFIKQAEQARQTINQWVEEQTQDKIKDLMPPGSIDAMTRLVLTNAIYFKGQWAEQFDKKMTADMPFFVSAEKKIAAPLMMLKERFKYAELDTSQIVELPYVDDELSMVVLLPKEKGALSKLEAQLTAENLAAWQGQMHKKEVVVYLPRFKMTSQFSLPKILAQMGMPDAFDIGKADFSGMTDAGGLFISDVLHKAFVEVNEEGTEAAAATGAVISLTSMPAPPPVFRADRPFVFLIKDNKTNSLLFLGRVTDPTKEE